MNPPFVFAFYPNAQECFLVEGPYFLVVSLHKASELFKRGVKLMKGRGLVFFLDSLCFLGLLPGLTQFLATPFGVFILSFSRRTEAGVGERGGDREKREGLVCVLEPLHSKPSRNTLDIILVDKMGTSSRLLPLFDGEDCDVFIAFCTQTLLHEPHH